MKKKIPEHYFYFLAILLLIPALLTNLGLVAFIDDEGIRALVALEMKLSNNFIVPTLFGEPYYNKPPLYNWILLATFTITQEINEWSARLPTVFFLLCYAGTIFYFFKKHFSTKIAFLNAFALITCGRILFYDSILGLIDICFSWVIFSLFMVVYHQWKRKELNRLFVGAYLLGAIGFMLKGLPAIVFLGTTLVAHFIYQRAFKKLFTFAHFWGILIFCFVIGSYYFAYTQYQPLSVIIDTLINESAKRTVVQYSWQDTVLHLFTFPFEVLYHFLPWTLLLIPLLFKKYRALVLKHEFLTYNILILFTTILVYWTSVEVYPRYLFMHVPLIFSTAFYVYFQSGRIKNSIEKIIQIAITVVIFAPLVVFFIDSMEVSFFEGKIIFLMSSFAALAFLYHYQKQSRLLVFVLVLLVARWGFDWFVLPSRDVIEWRTKCRVSAKEIGEKYVNEDLKIYKYSLGWQPITGFYITEKRQKILSRVYENIDQDAYYIFYPEGYKEQPFNKIDELKISDQQLILSVGQLKKNKNGK